jgi:tetratricopeptide (TPR) repeat protein
MFAALQGDEYLTSLDDAVQAVKENPDSAANLNNYGISLLYAGQPEEAREAFKNALALEPKLPGSLYNMAIVENFYFFDPTASNAYFAEYREVTKGHPLSDPDDLGTLLGQDAQTAAVSVEVSSD